MKLVTKLSLVTLLPQELRSWTSKQSLPSKVVPNLEIGHEGKQARLYGLNNNHRIKGR